MIQQSTENTPSVKSLALLVSGPDAAKFLQGQITCDVIALADGQSTLGAYCNIKGRVESLFSIQRFGDEFILTMHAELVAPTMQELKKYAVFSKVNLEIVEQPLATVDNTAEILAKIPALFPQTVGEFFPHDLNLPGLGAVSFTKGCYRGQEIVARMQHRGNIKRAMHVFKTTAATIQPGSQITTNTGNPSGVVVRAQQTAEGHIGLAVITDSQLKEPLFINGTAIECI